MAGDFPRFISIYASDFPWFSHGFHLRLSSLIQTRPCLMNPVPENWIVRYSPIVCLVISQLFAAEKRSFPDLCEKKNYHLGYSLFSHPFMVIFESVHYSSGVSHYSNSTYIYREYICSYTYPHDASLSFGSTPIINYYLLTIDLYPPLFVGRNTIGWVQGDFPKNTNPYHLVGDTIISRLGT
jgi:hypothetical protein